MLPILYGAKALYCLDVAMDRDLCCQVFMELRLYTALM